jgi:hypothetical protein
MVVGLPKPPRASAPGAPRLQVRCCSPCDRDLGAAQQGQCGWIQPFGNSTARRRSRKFRPGRRAVDLPPALRGHAARLSVTEHEGQPSRAPPPNRTRSGQLSGMPDQAASAPLLIRLGVGRLGSPASETLPDLHRPGLVTTPPWRRQSSHELVPGGVPPGGSANRSCGFRPLVVARNVDRAGRTTSLNARRALLRIARHESAPRRLSVPAAAAAAPSGGRRHTENRQDGGCDQGRKNDAHVRLSGSYGLAPLGNAGPAKWFHLRRASAGGLVAPRAGVAGVDSRRKYLG